MNIKPDVKKEEQNMKNGKTGNEGCEKHTTTRLS